MKDGMGINQRDIVLIIYPYSDLSQKKKRPVFVLSNNNYNFHNEDIICCAITSNQRNYANSIEFSSVDLESGGLPFESRIKSNKVFTLNQNLIIKKLARLSIEKSKEVVEKLDIFIKIEDDSN